MAARMLSRFDGGGEALLSSGGSRSHHIPLKLGLAPTARIWLLGNHILSCSKNEAYTETLKGLSRWRLAVEIWI